MASDSSHIYVEALTLDNLSDFMGGSGLFFAPLRHLAASTRSDRRVEFYRCGMLRVGDDIEGQTIPNLDPMLITCPTDSDTLTQATALVEDLEIRNFQAIEEFASEVRSLPEWVKTDRKVWYGDQEVYMTLVEKSLDRDDQTTTTELEEYEDSIPGSVQDDVKSGESDDEVSETFRRGRQRHRGQVANSARTLDAPGGVIDGIMHTMRRISQLMPGPIQMAGKSISECFRWERIFLTATKR